MKTRFNTKLFKIITLLLLKFEMTFSLNRLKVTFINNDGQRITVLAKEGDNLLDVVVNNELDFDGFGIYLCI